VVVVDGRPNKPGPASKDNYLLDIHDFVGDDVVPLPHYTPMHNALGDRNSV